MSTGLPLRLVFDPQGRELAAARDCEADVFLTSYGNTVDQLHTEYAPYDESSVFLALFRGPDRAIAACRLITPGPAGLKSLNDVSREPWGLDGQRAARAVGVASDSTWDVATIAVRRDAGAARILAAAALYHGLWTAARINHVRSIVMIMDERARRLLTAAGIVTQTLPGTSCAPYLGSTASTPLFGHLARMADTQRRVNPDAARLINQGIGLDGVQVPGPAEFLLRDRSRPGVDPVPVRALSA